MTGVKRRKTGGKIRKVLQANVAKAQGGRQSPSSPPTRYPLIPPSSLLSCGISGQCCFQGTAVGGSKTEASTNESAVLMQEAPHCLAQASDVAGFCPVCFALTVTTIKCALLFNKIVWSVASHALRPAQCAESGGDFRNK
ncbi:hypothetical protein BaRGS_00032099, partial [Batillaria attramentaria]